MGFFVCWRKIWEGKIEGGSGIVATASAGAAEEEVDHLDSFFSVSLLFPPVFADLPLQ